MRGDLIRMRAFFWKEGCVSICDVIKNAIPLEPFILMQGLNILRIRV